MEFILHVLNDYGAVEFLIRRFVDNNTRIFDGTMKAINVLNSFWNRALASHGLSYLGNGSRGASENLAEQGWNSVLRRNRRF